MKYRSTRGTADNAVGIVEAICAGLAPDGGLFVPVEWPAVQAGAGDYPSVATSVLAPFLDPAGVSASDVVAEAFDFPIELRPLENNVEMLELFHGPSAAFKDFGARFLASVMSRVVEDGERPITILVATSGDTGGAVASAFWRKPNTEVIVLFPKAGVSDRQRHQLTCWDTNVLSVEVEGVFDDCQRMVKAAFADEWWQSNVRLSSANSINIGRLLPQVTYYAWASLDYQKRHGQPAGFIIPSGNVGNALACVWAKHLGFPIREVVLAANANTPLTNWIESGAYEPKTTVATLANAMDVGAPSNMERLLDLYPTAPDFISATSVDDDEIKRCIATAFERWDVAICPHTACAVSAYLERGGDHWVLVSTAHPSKFESVVEPVIGQTVPLPPALAESLKRPTSCHSASSLEEIAELKANS